MIIFPQKTIVDVPSDPQIDGNCMVSVRINTDDDIKGLKEFYGKRLYNWEMQSKSLRNLEFLTNFDGSRVRITNTDISDFEDEGTIKALRNFTPVFIVDMNDRTARTVNFITSLNSKVHVRIYADYDAEVLFKTLDFYLHNPLLGVPIEPFHSLLRTIHEKRGATLWKIEQESIGVNFHVSNEGRVAFSKRWNDNNLSFGTHEDSFDDILQSDLFQKLNSYKTELFRNNSSCVFCEHFGPCTGFLRAIDPEWPCDSWKDVFEIFTEESEKAKALMKKFKK